MAINGKKNKGRLARKLFLLRIGVGLALGVTTSATAFVLAQRAMVYQIREDLAGDLLLLEAEARLFLHDRIMAVDNLAKDPLLQRPTDAIDKNDLIALLQRYGRSFASISVLDRHGRERIRLCMGSNSTDLRDLSTDNGYRTALYQPNRTIVTGATQNGQGDTVFRLYRYCRTPNGVEIGTLTAAVPAREFSNALKGSLEIISTIMEKRTAARENGSLDSGEIERFMVTDRNGVVLAHTNERMIGRGVASLSPALSKAKPVFGDAPPVTIDRTAFFVDSIPMGLTGWRLYFLADRDEALAPIRRLGLKIFLLTLTFLAGAELFSRRLGLNLTEPINRLLAKTREITEAGIGGGRVEWKSRDELGELAESFNTMLDRLEEAHDALNREKQFIEDIFDAMEEGLVVADIHGTISEHNRAARELLGADDLTGRSLGEFFPATMPVHTWWPQVAAGKKMSNIETVITSTKGEEIDVSVSLAPLLQDASARGLVCGISDIRERKKLEADRARAAARLQEVRDELMAAEKLAVVGQMSGLVAHEVLNPISAINIRVSMALPAMEELAKVIGVLEGVAGRLKDHAGADDLAVYLASEQGRKDLLLLEKIAAALREKLAERSEDFRFLDRQVARVIKIIDNLREMSRHRRTVEEFRLVKLVDEVIDDQRDGLAKRGIRVEKMFRADPVVRADYMEIYSIFSNLLRNAIHAIDEKATGDGTVTFAVDLDDEGNIMATVSDNGCGMDSESIENLFVPGFTSKGRKGTGLGLSYSRKIARALNGDLFLEKSIPGEGSTFSVVIPAHDGKADGEQS